MQLRWRSLRPEERSCPDVGFLCLRRHGCVSATASRYRLVHNGFKWCCCNAAVVARGVPHVRYL